MWRRRLWLVSSTALVLMVVLVAVAGNRQFKHASEDPLTRADAVVVLGGEHDGRQAYGIHLAEKVGAPTVLVSNPYPSEDSVMRTWCGKRRGGVRVICDRPPILTTRGEAMMARKYGRELGWRRIVVVSWRYHLPRARFIFGQCYSSDPDQVVMQAVPRSYSQSVAYWEAIYAYQYGGFAKAVLQGSCPR
jgi:uncharacterized SAM-binding protein YcdF (DUF218 family)